MTITTKTFVRYGELKVLIESIRKFYPAIKIIIADDSLKPETVSGSNIEQYIMPPGQVYIPAIYYCYYKYFDYLHQQQMLLVQCAIEH